MRYDAGFQVGMGSPTLKIVLSLLGAGLAGWVVLILLESVLPGAPLFRFQLSSMIAMAIFAGIAIVIYVRLSRIRK
jgi:hypothetical protein